MADPHMHTNASCYRPRYWHHVHASEVIIHKTTTTSQHTLNDRSSPRWLMTEGREDECLDVLAGLRRKSTTHEGVRLEFLEVKAQAMFEKETSVAKFPEYQDNTFMSNLKLGYHQYLSLLTNRSLFKRVCVAVFIMVFQQCKF